MLRTLRIITAALFFLCITFCFLDFAHIFPASLQAFFPSTQFLPALLSLNIGVLVVLLSCTLLLGRVYCSAICPLGVFQDMINTLASKIHPKRKRGYHKNRPQLRWGIAAVVFAAWLFGFTFLLGLVAPYSMYGRMAVQLLQPLYVWGNNLMADSLMQYDNYTFYTVELAVRSAAALAVAGITFAAIVFFAYAWGRTYCNIVCPVGTLLGYLSKFSLLKMRIDVDKCNHCKQCGRKCKAYCIDPERQRIDYSRCLTCFNCIGYCRQGAIYYGLSSKKNEKELPMQPDESRRAFLKTGTATAVALPFILPGKAQELIPAELKSAQRTLPITPPGSIGRENLSSHCTSCHLCITKCPNGILKPSLTEYGIGGFLQPTVDYKNGCCDVECTACGDVCPTGAIRPLTVGLRRRTQVGIARYTMDHCIVESDGVACGMCSRNCPMEAIRMIPYREGLELPEVDAERCIGCGACEYYCPTTPLKGMTVDGYDLHSLLPEAK